jgi:hypothetical protein
MLGVQNVLNRDSGGWKWNQTTHRVAVRGY